MIKRERRLGRGKNITERFVLRLRSSDSSNIGDQAGGKFHLLHHCS